VQPNRPEDPPSPEIADYACLRCIGRGSYGEVWLAQGVTGLFRAIKVVWRDRFADAAPFEREFKGLKEFAAISLGESIQMALLHVGRNDAAGFFYYVMELADDAELGRQIIPERYVPLTLAEVRVRRGRLPAAECVALGLELARVLAGLHRRGLLHRDVKPSNVILVDGVPKLADIGLVAPQSEAHTYVGTEGFVPPEGPGSPGADAFAVGKLLYELSTGFDRLDFPQLPPALRELPDHRELLALNAVILRACDADPARRYRDGTALLQDLESLQAGRSIRSRWFRRTLAPTAILAVLMIGAGGMIWWNGSRSDPAAVATVPAVDQVEFSKSIAVLPFLNLSDEKENAFFTDGVHEDILTNLALISELRVVSRTTVMRYRTTTKPARDIASELGVAYLLEGSVRRVGNKVRVTGQLIDARTDEHVWARNYDRDLTDVFAIQSALAQEIARALSAAISPQTQRLLARRPTENAIAYDDYLKGRDSRNRSLPADPTALRDQEALFRSAVRQDPHFAAAWAELAVIHALHIFWEVDYTPLRLKQGDEALAEAVRLAPESPDVIRARGSFAYNARRDYEGATKIYEELARLQPNDATVFTSLGLIQRRQGHWADSLINLRRAAALDPANVSNARNLISSLIRIRRWDEARTVQLRLMALIPDELRERFFLATGEFYATGRWQAANELLASLPPGERDHPVAIDFRRHWAYLRGDVAAYRQLTAEWPRQESPTQVAEAALESAVLARAHGDLPTVRAHLEPIMAEVRARTVREPGGAKAWAFAAGFEALFGDRAEAVRLARKAMEIMPESVDAVDGAIYRARLAWVYAVIGDKDKAIDELTRSLRGPGIYTVSALRTDPAFAALRGDPRFEAMLADPKNSDPVF
jgi:adenylate cyclase